MAAKAKTDPKTTNKTVAAKKTAEKAATKTATKKVSTSEDAEEEVVEKTAAKKTVVKKTAAPKKASTKKAKSEEEDADEDIDTSKTAPKKAAKKDAVKASKKSKKEDEEDEDDEDDVDDMIIDKEAEVEEEPEVEPEPIIEVDPVIEEILKEAVPEKKAPAKRKRKDDIPVSPLISSREAIIDAVHEKRTIKNTGKVIAQRVIKKEKKKDDIAIPEFTPKKRSLLDEPEVKPTTRKRYSDEELDEFKELIVKRLDTAKAELAYLQNLITRKDEAGTEDSDNKFNSAEDGSGAMEREQISQLAGRQIQFINHLENALLRIENKTYGVCRVTGELIDKARLRAVPHATLSIEAKKAQR